MQRFLRSFSLNSKKNFTPEASKPYLWQEDEKAVRDGTCNFQVKYLGCTEVYDSRGIQVCEEAISVLKCNKAKCSHAVLSVSGDALRVVDEATKGLIVDQTIEKVSFCAPDRTNDRGFAYICRDGTSRRWMCHCFLSLKDHGERLSHAVGCAFTICLERKQQRDKEKMSAAGFRLMETKVSVDSNSTNNVGLFRHTSLVERLTDPQSAIVAEPIPACKCETPYAVRRPHAPVTLLKQQNLILDKFAETYSPFKHQLSSESHHDSSYADYCVPSDECLNVERRCTTASSSNVSVVPPPAPSAANGVVVHQPVNELQNSIKCARNPDEWSCWFEERSSTPQVETATLTGHDALQKFQQTNNDSALKSLSPAELWLRSTASAICTSLNPCPVSHQ